MAVGGMSLLSGRCFDSSIKLTVKIKPKVKIADLKPQKRTSATWCRDTLSPGPPISRVYQPMMIL